MNHPLTARALSAARFHTGRLALPAARRACERTGPGKKRTKAIPANCTACDHHTDPKGFGWDSSPRLVFVPEHPFCWRHPPHRHTRPPWVLALRKQPKTVPCSTAGRPCTVPLEATPQAGVAVGSAPPAHRQFSSAFNVRAPNVMTTRLSFEVPGAPHLQRTRTLR